MTWKKSSGAMTTLVSVITPTLNSETFIHDCLKSVQIQNSSDICVEHIIVDGGSQDLTFKIFQQFNSEDKNRFIIANGTTQSEALNIGLANINPQTNWIGWLNSDERYEADAFKNLIDNQLDNLHSCVLYGDFFRINAEGKKLKLNRQWNYDLSIGTLLTPTIQNCSALFNISCLPEPFINEKYNFIMDWDFYVRIMKKDHARATYVPKVIGNYMMQSHSKTAQNQEMFKREIAIFNSENYPTQSLLFIYLLRKVLILKFFIILLKERKFFDKLYFKLIEQRKYKDLFGK